MPAGRGDRWPEDYERGRPGWPAEVVDVPGLPPASTVLELGAGTGKLTRLLVQTFERVVAVEPAEPMRRLLAALCPEAEAVDGAAEEIALADHSVDGAFAAEAFHRFDHARAVAELARVLRPGGALVLLWNLQAGPTEPSIADAERYLAAQAPGGRAELGYDPLDLNTVVYESGTWRAAFAGSPFEPLREARLPNPQTVDRDELVAFFASMGWLADLPDPERLTVLEGLRSRLADTEFLRLWETHVHWTRLPNPGEVLTKTA